MTTHELKTDPKPFDDVVRGSKRFEIRKNDRNFDVFDCLHLRETLHTGEEMAKGAELIYTGRECLVTVVHILRGPIYGLVEGWVILSVEPTDSTAPQPSGQIVGYFVNTNDPTASTTKYEQVDDEFKSDPDVVALCIAPSPAVVGGEADKKCREIIEVLVGMEGFEPETAPEAYQQRILKQIEEIVIRQPDLEESPEYKHLALIWNNFKQLVNAQDMPKQGVTFEMVQAARRILKLERHGESK
jgi:hypothetical protein